MLEGIRLGWRVKVRQGCGPKQGSSQQLSGNSAVEKGPRSTLTGQFGLSVIHFLTGHIVVGWLRGVAKGVEGGGILRNEVADDDAHGAVVE